MSERRIQILLADDHPMMLEGLRRLLELDFEVVGVAREGHELLEAARTLQPDIVITDISMAGMDGLEATRRLQATLPRVRVLILSYHSDPSFARAAFEAGASAYLTKTSAPEELELAVRAVVDGRLFVSSAVTRGMVEASVPVPPERLLKGQPAGDPLTRRETDVVRLVGQGLGNKDIAHRLGVSVTTVRTHLNRVYDKLKPASRVELALFASHSADATT
jgi:DNA-binding NarL/FixJ family response regulator